MGHENEYMENMQELLMEYYRQSVEDCRVIGNQKYNVLVAIAVGAGTLLYAAANISGGILNNPFLFSMGLIASLMVLFCVHSLVFLTFHLSNMVKVTQKIEEYQKDLLFKKIENDNYLSENISDLKNQLDELSPHLAVYKTSKSVNLLAWISVVFILGLFLYWCIIIY